MFDKHRNNKQANPQANETKSTPSSPPLTAREPASSARSAIIGPGITISGDVSASSDLLVNGKISGSVVQCTHSVEIGNSGQVKARIQAKLIKVSGEVLGDMKAGEKVLISKTGRVKGNISSPRVQLEDGAIYKGSIDMTPVEPAQPAKPAPEKKAASAPPSRPDTAAGTGNKPAEAASGSGASPAAKSSSRKEPSLTLKSG
jgi:cytoskeletal protein CcmA (bactofilin family)